MYNPKSAKAEEFINHEEILATLSYADENKHNETLIREILAKAKLEKGLSHREASVLLACDIPELNEEIFPQLFCKQVALVCCQLCGFACKMILFIHIYYCLSGFFLSICLLEDALWSGAPCCGRDGRETFCLYGCLCMLCPCPSRVG